MAEAGLRESAEETEDRQKTLDCLVRFGDIKTISAGQDRERLGILSKSWLWV